MVVASGILAASVGTLHDEEEEEEEAAVVVEEEEAAVVEGGLRLSPLRRSAADSLAYVSLSPQSARQRGMGRFSVTSSLECRQENAMGTPK